jgi:hypothetical protein
LTNYFSFDIIALIKVKGEIVMKIFELSTRNGRVFRVATANKNQEERLKRVVNKNRKKGGYEVFTDVKCITNGIHSISDFETLSESLVV